MTAANTPSPLGHFGIHVNMVRLQGARVGDVYYDADGKVMDRVFVVCTGDLTISGPTGSEIVTLYGSTIAERFGDGWLVARDVNSVRTQAIFAGSTPGLLRRPHAFEGSSHGRRIQDTQESYASGLRGAHVRLHALGR